MVGVILHDMPQNRPVADVDQGLGSCLRIILEPRSEATTKQYHFHDKTSGEDPRRGLRQIRTR